MGGIGNQLFQLNLCNYLKKTYPDADIRCDISFYNTARNSTLINETHGGFLIDNLPFPTIQTSRLRTFNVISDRKQLTKLNINQNYYFEGYWQRPEFLTLPDSINDVFDTTKISNKNLEIKNKILSFGKKSVALHVRCGDYNNLFNLGNVATKAYYNNAIEYLSKEITDAFFFIFSNDIEWAKKNLNIKNNVYFVDSNDAEKQAVWDLYLMSLCSNYIISNSSFSLWAQFFNQSTDKIVVTPEYWANEKTSFSKYGENHFQDAPYIKKVSNIPAVKSCLNAKLSFLVKENKNLPALRRFITAALNQYSDNIKIYVLSNNKQIKALITSYNKTNAQVELISKNAIDSTKTSSVYYTFIKTNYYLMQDSFNNLMSQLEAHSDCKTIYVPVSTQPKGTVITQNSKKYKLPVIFNNFAKSKNSSTLSVPSFCLVDYNNISVFKSLKLFIKTCIKKMLRPFLK